MISACVTSSLTHNVDMMHVHACERCGAQMCRIYEFKQHVHSVVECRLMFTWIHSDYSDGPHCLFRLFIAIVWC